jgi:acetyl esterase/lipase
MAEPLADSALTGFLAELNAQPSVSAAEVGPRAMRARAEERAAARPKGPEMHTVRDVVTPPNHIPARLYRPVAQWVPDPAMRADPRVSPLYAPDLTGLPPAIVITCEHDPLRDQGEAYAARLRDAGVLLTGRREQGMVHNFMYWDLISPACSAAADRVAADLRSALAAASGR